MATRDEQFLTDTASQVVQEIHEIHGLSKKQIMSAGVMALRDELEKGNFSHLVKANDENPLKDIPTELLKLWWSLSPDQKKSFAAGVGLAVDLKKDLIQQPIQRGKKHHKIEGAV